MFLVTAQPCITLAHPHNTMLDVELIYIVGASAIGAASVAYILFGFSSTTTHQIVNKNVPIRGLKNMKNNCFINSILQSLANSDSMMEWLGSANRKLHFKGKLISEVLNLTKKINKMNKDSKTLTPHEVLNILREYRWVISNEEQDAHELFNVLTTTIENEMIQNSFVVSIYDLITSHKKNLNGCRSVNANTFTSRVNGAPMQLVSSDTLPTRIILVNHLTCQTCHYKYPLHLDAFNSISLSLPPSVFNTSLESCLFNFVRDEKIDDYSCDHCSNKLFCKKIEFLKLPRLLCFHIQRQTWLTCDQLLKRFDYVKFPEILVMDPFMYQQRVLSQSTCDKPEANGMIANGDHCHCSTLSGPSKTRFRYFLNSVIVHLGTDSSGHFICYRRKLDSKSRKLKWYYTSDLVVEEVSRKEVLACSAYMLFYEKIVNS